jgi:hypothetical protein
VARESELGLVEEDLGVDGCECHGVLLALECSSQTLSEVESIFSNAENPIQMLRLVLKLECIKVCICSNDLYHSRGRIWRLQGTCDFCGRGYSRWPPI